jgi:hypothetical protein
MIKLTTNNDKIMTIMINNVDIYHYSTLNFINFRYSKVSRGACALLRLNSHY